MVGILTKNKRGGKREDIMLHVKHRPDTFDEFFGNEILKKTLRELLEQPEGDRPQAYLFYGRRGAGKTTLANILKNYLDAEVINITGSGVDDVRELLRQARYGSIAFKNKLFVIDEAHMLSKKAVDELLKEIEEPKKSIYFVLCTNEHLKLADTLRSRLTRFEVKNLDKETAFEFLKTICKKEKIKVAKKTLTYLASRFEGNPRDMLVALNKIRNTATDATASKKVVDELTEDDEELIFLLRTLLKKPSTGISNKVIELQQVLGKCFEKIKSNPELSRMIIGRYMAKVAMNPSNWEVSGDLGELLVELGNPFYHSGADIKLIGLILKIHTILLKKWQ